MTKNILSFIIVLGLSVSTAYSYVAQIPLFDGENSLGDIEASIEEEKIVWIEKTSLLNSLKNYANDSILNVIQQQANQIPPTSLPFTVHFDPVDFKVLTAIKVELRSQKKTDLGINLDAEKKYALYPAPFGGAINYRLEQMWAPENIGGNYFNGQFNSFFNFNSVVLENQTFYQDNIDKKWYRGDTRLIKDFERQKIRLQLGDIYPEIQGFMSPVPLGGINLHRNFSIDPYRLPYPTGDQSFTIKSRSFVKYYVNSVLVKSEYLAPGNYKAVDIPLSNGLNTVLIEAEDELGEKSIFIFRSSSNISLLNKGESKFDLSYGATFSDIDLERKYDERNGKVFSGFYQYGFSSVFSASTYLQSRQNLNLYGLELINAVPFGNFMLGHGRSDFENSHGSASSLGYQLITQGQKWFDSNTLLVRYENREKNFRNTPTDLFSDVQNLYSANYTVPLSDFLTFSLGGNYGDVRDNTLSDKYGYDANLSIRIYGQHNLTLYVNRTRDAFKKWNETAYAFLTIMIPESNSYISALYDQKQNSTRVNALYDNQNILYGPRMQGTVENTERMQNGEFDLSVPTPVGDIGGRVGGRSERSKLDSFASVRFNSSFVFAYGNGEFAKGISRPVPGSFVIFKPEDRLKDQKIGLKSTSPYTESESGLFDEVVFTNLIPYQYRDIQLDPTYLDEGRTLSQEKFMLYPRYKSAHLIKLEERGAVILTGKIIDSSGAPYALQVGSISGVPFFTNREGEIFIEGIETGNHVLQLDNKDISYPIFINEDERGMKNIGVIKLKDDE